VLASETGEWFEETYPSPFMVMCSRTQPARRDEMAAVNHVDDTARLQTVTAETNPRYHRLIEAFAARTGVPMLLNTSFNENEPIVCTPRDALACFQKTRMDLLVLGNYVLEQPGGASHAAALSAEPAAEPS
jgi:carbamoyltransferase